MKTKKNLISKQDNDTSKETNQRTGIPQNNVSFHGTIDIARTHDAKWKFGRKALRFRWRYSRRSGWSGQRRHSCSVDRSRLCEDVITEVDRDFSMHNKTHWIPWSVARKRFVLSGGSKKELTARLQFIAKFAGVLYKYMNKVNVELGSKHRAKRRTTKFVTRWCLIEPCRKVPLDYNHLFQTNCLLRASGNFLLNAVMAHLRLGPGIVSGNAPTSSVVPFPWSSEVYSTIE